MAGWTRLLLNSRKLPKISDKALSRPTHGKLYQLLAWQIDLWNRRLSQTKSTYHYAILCTNSYFNPIDILCLALTFKACCTCFSRLNSKNNMIRRCCSSFKNLFFSHFKSCFQICTNLVKELFFISRFNSPLKVVSKLKFDAQKGFLNESKNLNCPKRLAKKLLQDQKLWAPTDTLLKKRTKTGSSHGHGKHGFVRKHGQKKTFSYFKASRCRSWLQARETDYPAR